MLASESPGRTQRATGPEPQDRVAARLQPGRVRGPSRVGLGRRSGWRSYRRRWDNRQRPDDLAGLVPQGDIPDARQHVALLVGRSQLAGARARRRSGRPSCSRSPRPDIQSSVPWVGDWDYLEEHDSNPTSLAWRRAADDFANLGGVVIIFIGTFRPVPTRPCSRSSSSSISALEQRALR